jgi:Protein of unknown function (DUF3298)
MKRLVFTLIGLCFSLGTAWALPKTVVIKETSANFDQEIKYPQDFAAKNIDKIVRERINAVQNALLVQGNLSAEVPGKSSLNIDYKTEFQARDALSLVFFVATYTPGAAHPNNSVITLNFLSGQQVSLEQLFQANSDYLTQIAKFSLAAIAKKRIVNQDWLTRGTKPTEENYKNWFFSKNGLTIVFDTYQVAPYVYGPQMVEIPKARLAKLLRPEVINSVWGN